MFESVEFHEPLTPCCGTDTSFFEGRRDEWIRACRKCYQPIEFVKVMGHQQAVVVRYV